jgi:hypothetical protein
LRTTAIAPIPVASNNILAGSGTVDIYVVIPANAGSDKAKVTAESTKANLRVLFTAQLLFGFGGGESHG